MYAELAAVCSNAQLALVPNSAQPSKHRQFASRSLVLLDDRREKLEDFVLLSARRLGDLVEHARLANAGDGGKFDLHDTVFVYTAVRHHRVSVRRTPGLIYTTASSGWALGQEHPSFLRFRKGG